MSKQKLDKNNVQDIICLSPMQEGMLFYYMRNPLDNMYYVQLSINLNGEIIFDIFKKAWELVIKTNDALRTVFRYQNLRTPIQVILKEHNIPITFHDLHSQYLKGDIDKKLNEIKEDLLKSRIDITNAPFILDLCRKSDSNYELIITYHHIICDGWSNVILIQEFIQYYHQLLNNKKIKIKSKLKFKEYIKWNKSRDYEKIKYYWQNYLNDYDENYVYPQVNNNLKESTTYYKKKLNFEIIKQMKEFLKYNNFTFAVLLYCAWGILLYQNYNTKKVIFGTTISGRPSILQGIEDIVGMFINTIPVIIDFSFNSTILDMLKTMDNNLKERTDFENTPLLDIHSYCNIPHNNPLFNSVVVIENYPISTEFGNGHNLIKVEKFSVVDKANYDLILGVLIFDSITFTFEYNEGIYSNIDIEKLASQLLKIIYFIINNPEQKIDEIILLSNDEKKKMKTLINNLKNKNSIGFNLN